MKMLVLAVMFLFAESAFAHTSAAGLNQTCSSLDAKGKDVYSIDRNSDLGFCIGYMNAIFDSIENNSDLVVVKDFIVADVISSFRRYAPQHYAEAADTAVVNALIADGFLRHRPKT
jgi:hypothetical protein